MAPAGALLRVPTHVGWLQALQRPEAVDWRAEVDVLERQPMRALYTMQVVCAKLLPVEVPHDSYGAAVQQMASWKARFMAHGFVTLFETFVALASMARSDSLHMTMLTTSLSVVKACLVGYLHANNGASIAASLGAGATPRTPPLKAADGDAPPRPEVLRSGSLGRHPRGFSLKDGRRPSKAASPTDGTPPRRGSPTRRSRRGRSSRRRSGARAAARPAGDGGAARARAGEQRRQAALDVLKLDAVLAATRRSWRRSSRSRAAARADAAAHPPAEVNRGAGVASCRTSARPAGGGGPRARAARGAPHAVEHAATSAEFWSSSPTSSRCPRRLGAAVAAAEGGGPPLRRPRAVVRHAARPRLDPRGAPRREGGAGVAALRATLARTSASCAASSARASASCARRVVGAGGDAQPSTARHAGIGLSLATVGADGGQRSLGALLPVVDEMDARDASDEGFDPAGDLRKTHVGLVNQGDAT